MIVSGSYFLRPTRFWQDIRKEFPVLLPVSYILIAASLSMDE